MERKSFNIFPPRLYKIVELKCQALAVALSVLGKKELDTTWAKTA